MNAKYGSNCENVGDYKVQGVFNAGISVLNYIPHLSGPEAKRKFKGPVFKAKYFSISVDSTPNVSHCDQLVACARYVKNDEPIERFI